MHEPAGAPAQRQSGWCGPTGAPPRVCDPGTTAGAPAPGPRGRPPRPGPPGPGPRPEGSPRTAARRSPAGKCRRPRR
ncbi:MAG: hypothetical protein CWE10_15950 [Symbiobacterium thermophilum]|uniref:Uncharacterized protein n=1 Tax=Symbiobacterium thermophilum TaxID=2734 RepID=A0A953I3F4_SYMTR|nr:hypothetical protein [Symbiobacterium thermophilum]